MKSGDGEEINAGVRRVQILSLKYTVPVIRGLPRLNEPTNFQGSITMAPYDVSQKLITRLNASYLFQSPVFH